MCYDELAYLITGKNAVATINKTYESRSRRGTTQTVEYGWTEPDGTQRKDMTEMSTNWVPPSDGKLAICSTPGKDGRSRFLGQPKWTWIVSFCLSIAMVAFFMYLMWKEATADDKPRKGKRPPIA
jgi:hypothetical protein